MTYFARALGASRMGDLANAKSAIDSLGSIQRALSAKNEAYWAEQVTIHARELLGDMLMELKRPNEAMEEYRATLRKEPNRRHSLRRVEGRTANGAGNQR